MKWIVATACVLLVLVMGLFFLRNTPRSLAEGGCMVADPADRLDPSVQVCFPGPTDEWSAYFWSGRENCTHPVDDLAKLLNSKPTAVAVARAYSRQAAWWMGGEAKTSDMIRVRAAYDGCLQALRRA